MALAPYFEKAALGAVQLLAGVSVKRFEELLTPVCIGIALDRPSEPHSEATRIADLLTNLVARLYPKLHISGEEGQAEKLMASASAINPRIEFVGSEQVRIWVSIGNREIPSSTVPVVHVSSDGWTARVSQTPSPCGKTANPFGAGAAACLAAANLFRIVFAEYLEAAEPDRELTLCLFDYAVNCPECRSSHPEPGGVLAEGTVLVGGGAIGNGVLWALSRSSLTGALAVIDPESVDETNPQRYILTCTATRLPKVDLAVEACTGSGITVVPFSGTWADFIDAGRDYSLVATALDSAQARIEVQASLPLHVLNAWTQAGDLGVSRHMFLGNQACLACLYIPPRARPSDDELVRQAIRFSGDLIAVRTMLYTNTPLDMSWIERIASDLKIDKERVLPFLGRPLRELYQRGICGGILLDVSEQGQHAAVEVPMAFQSAMAGIMLAAETVLYSMRIQSPPPVTTKLNLLRPIGRMLSESEEKHPSGRCICQDEYFIEAYKEKFPEIAQSVDFHQPALLKE